MTSAPVLLAVLPLFVLQGGTPSIPVLDQHELQVAMARLATEHPGLVTIVPVGESRGKRRIEALRLAGAEFDPRRPAMLIVANVDGPLVWTSALVLDHARVLAERYSGDATVRELLDTTTVYVVPRADPDAAEARFAEPLFEQRASGAGVDDDRDGRQGEDPPGDVDGDGFVTWMRVPDAEGEWMADPADERALVKADRAKGQRGRWKLVREGRDSDRDETAAEDQELDAVVNRNFPAGWEEHQRDSGRFATDEPPARALCDFVLLHREIALVVTYGTLDNVVEKPKTEGKTGRASTIPSAGVPEADVGVYAELGRRFEKIGQGVEGDGKDAGTFQAWVQSHRGLWAIHIAPWSVPLDDPAKESAGGDAKKEGEAGREEAPGGASQVEPKPDAGSEPVADSGPQRKPGTKGSKSDEKSGPSDDAKRLRWIGEHGHDERFVPWRPFQHPELGAVEIGGFAPYALVEPPEDARAEIARKNVEFLITLAGDVARLKLVDVTATDQGSGLWLVEAVLVNDGYLPYASALGERTRTIRPARVRLEPREAQILAGERQILVRELAGSGGRKELRWIVRGVPPSGMRIVVDSDHAGTTSAVPEVK